MTQAGAYLRLSAQRYPDRACLVFGDSTEQTFAETNSRVNRLASALTAAGVRKGDRVALLAIDGGGYIETLFACMKLGATYVPLNNRLTEPELLTLLDRAEPVALFVSSRYAGVAARLAPRVAALRLVVSYDGSADPAAAPLVYEDLLASGADVEPDVEVSDDDVLGLAFTSGTTGLPKGVLQPQRMIKALVINMSIDYEIVPGEFRYTASPMFHIAGQAMVIMHVWRGFPTLVLPAFDEAAILAWMHSGRLTGAFLVPTMINRLLDHPDVHKGSYAGIRSIIYGGAPMSPALLERALAVFDCGFINAFGASTEGGLQAVFSTADHVRALAGEPELLGSIGKPSFGVEMRIVDPAGVDVAPGEVGEIITRSDPVMSGYLEMPAETSKAIVDGWFHAGDLARMDPNGYLYLAGRSKDMIIRGGENIYPVEIETVLADYPGVAQVAVVGRPDELWQEVVVAYLVLEPGASVDIDAVRAHCASRLAKFKIPVAFEILPEMPLNASGKILKRSLRDRVPTPDPVPTRG